MKNILTHEALKKSVQKTFVGKPTEILERPHSLIIRLKKESNNLVKRIIILPPFGYTANDLNELSSHDEVRKAKIDIKGILRDGKKNFSLLKKCLEFSYLTKRDATIEKGVPYGLISDNKNIHKTKVLSSKEKFYVVKENGEGFYHNLINRTNEPLVLILSKELKSGKKMNLLKKIKELDFNLKEKSIINELFKNIYLYGDELFKKDIKLVEKSLNIDTSKLVPALIEGLNIFETGRHEACTVYALILKKAKIDGISTILFLEDAIKQNKAPNYYLSELIKKINLNS